MKTSTRLLAALLLNAGVLLANKLVYAAERPVVLTPSMTLSVPAAPSNSTTLAREQAQAAAKANAQSGVLFLVLDATERSAVAQARLADSVGAARVLRDYQLVVLKKSSDGTYTSVPVSGRCSGTDPCAQDVFARVHATADQLRALTGHALTEGPQLVVYDTTHARPVGWTDRSFGTLRSLVEFRSALRGATPDHPAIVLANADTLGDTGPAVSH